MLSSLRLLRVLNEKNFKLIARRLSGDLSIDPPAAEKLLLSPPVDILQGVPGEKARKYFYEYEKLGCLMEKKEEAPGHPELPRHREAASVPAPLPATPHPHSTPHLSSPAAVAAAPPKPNPRRRQAIMVGVLLIVVSLLTVLWPKKRPPAISTVLAVAQAGEEFPGAVEQRVTEAEGAATAEERIEGLKAALTQNPGHPLVKRRLSRAYADRANAEYSAESRLKFYEIALAFNPTNEAASEGLARAYRESGNPKAEHRVTAEWRQRVRESSRELSRAITALGNVSGLPRIVGDTLIFRYRSGAPDEESLALEMRAMALKLREARNFEAIRITALGPGAPVTRAF